MGVFRTHLWKEWREHRVVLASIAVAILVLTAGACWFLRRQAADLERLAPFFGLVGTTLAVLALTSELFAAEGRRDRFGFLRRTPGALGAAVAAKFVFYTFGAVLMAVFSMLAYAICVDAIVFQSPETVSPWVLISWPSYWAYAAAAFIAGFWCLLASTWLSRGAAGIGAGLVALTATVAPAWLLLRDQPRLPIAATAWWGIAIGLIVVPVLAASVSVLRGLRFLRTPWSAAWRGLVTVSLFAAPAYGYAMERQDAWIHFDPSQPEARIRDAYVSLDGRRAFVDATRGNGVRDAFGRDLLTRPWMVNLETGAWEVVGPVGSYLVPGDFWGGGYGTVSTYGCVGVSPPVGNGEQNIVTWRDANTGTPLRTLPGDVWTPDRIKQARADLRRTTSVRLPNGRPVWIRDRHVEYDGDDGQVHSVAMPVAAQSMYPILGGWRAQWRDGQHWSNGLLIPTDDGSLRYIASPPDAWFVAVLSPARFLLSLRSKATTRAGYLDWRTDGSEGAPVPSLDPTDIVIAGISDHEVLAMHSVAGSRSELRVVDVDTGATSPITGGDESSTPIRECYVVGHGSELIISTTTVNGVRAIGRWKPGTRVLVDSMVVPTDARILATIDGSKLFLVEGGRQLVRRTWGSTTREVLFPR